jgi:hypothetical protein
MEERVNKAVREFRKDPDAVSKKTEEAIKKMGVQPDKKMVEKLATQVWLDRATIQFRFFGPSSFNTALQLVLRPHFLVHFV